MKKQIFNYKMFCACAENSLEISVKIEEATEKVKSTLTVSEDSKTMVTKGSFVRNNFKEAALEFSAMLQSPKFFKKIEKAGFKNIYKEGQDLNPTSTNTADRL